MTGNDKTQPQKLLEEILPPLEEVMAMNASGKPKRKWSLSRRRKYNATVRNKKWKRESDWIPVPPPAQETVQQIRFCPHCGGNIEKFLG